MYGKNKLYFGRLFFQVGQKPGKGPLLIIDSTIGKVGFLPRILQWLMCQQANQLSLVVYPIVYKVLYIPGG